MQASRDELRRSGFIGTASYFLRWIVALVPVPTLCFCCYWMAITVSAIWIKAVGANMFVANFFCAIFSIGSIVIGIFCCIGVLRSVKLIPHVYIILTVLSFICGFVILSLASAGQAYRYTENIIDYCLRNPTAVAFCTTQGDRWNVENYVRTRTTLAYGALTGVLSPWIIFFIAYLLVTAAVGSHGSGSPRRKAQVPAAAGQPQPTMERVDEPILNIEPEEDNYSYMLGYEEEEEQIDKQQIQVADA